MDGSDWPDLSLIGCTAFRVLEELPSVLVLVLRMLMSHYAVGAYISI